MVNRKLADACDDYLRDRHDEETLVANLRAALADPNMVTAARSILTGADELRAFVIYASAMKFVNAVEIFAKKMLEQAGETP